jgi:hypothetical protein
MRVDQATRAYMQQTGQKPSPQRSPARSVTPPRLDSVTFSVDAQVLGRLNRMWGALAWLFGVGSQGQGQGTQPWADLSGLREALQQAQQNARIAKERTGVLTALKTSVLRNAEALINKYYGLQGDGSPLRVQFEEDMGSALASVSFDYDRQGRQVNQVMHLNMSELTPDTSANGVNDHVIQNDRIIAHELTHAIMGRNMDMQAIPDWFAEGTAEYIAGAAERVGIVLKSLSPKTMLGSLLQPWQGDTVDYAAGYLAVRYLDRAPATAEGGGIKAIMERLKAGDSLDTAIAQVSGGYYKNADDYLTAFVKEGEGLAFLQTIDLSGKEAGSVKPGPGPAVVPDVGTPSNQPLQGFRVVWPSPLDGLQIGAPLSGLGIGPGSGTGIGGFPWLSGAWGPGAGFGAGFTPASAALAAYRRQVSFTASRQV